MTSANDQQLADEALRRGWLSPQQLQWCWQELQRRRAQGQNSTLAHLLLEGQLLSPDQIQALTSAQANSGGESIDITLTVPTGMVAVPKSAFQNSSGSQSGPSQSGPGLKPPSYAGQSHSGSQELPGSQSIEQVAGSFDFEIEEKVAQGGMGAIYKARDPLLERQVAMKLSLTPGSEQAFFGEAKITGQLEHPNIIPIHNAGVTPEGKPYFTMKFVKGRTLEQALEDGLDDCEPGTWEALPRYLEVFLKLCDGMAFAHSKGIIHRDLKPENVMIGEFGEVLVLDWGLAKKKFDKNTGAMAGTPKYMAPEQAAGERLTTRTDVYGLGAVLYQILCGQAPIETDDSEGRIQLMKKIMDSEIRPPTERNPDWAAPNELVAVAMKALSKEPRDRYRKVKDLQQDIRDYLDGRSVSAYQDSFTEAVVKAVKRHHTVTAIVALFSSILLGIMIWSFIQTLQSTRALRDQKTRAKEALAEIETQQQALQLELKKLAEADARRRDAALLNEGMQALSATLYEKERLLEIRDLSSKPTLNEFRDLVKAQKHKKLRWFARLGLLRALIHFRKFDQALRLIKQLEEQPFDARRLRRLRLEYYMASCTRTHPEFLSFLKDFAKNEPGSGIPEYLEAREQTDASKKLQLLAVALSRCPRLSLAYGQQALAFDAMQDSPKKVLDSCHKALAISPSLAYVLGLKGMTLRKINRKFEAQGYLLRAQALNDELAFVHRELGWLYKDKQRLDEALVAYNKALKLNSKDASAHLGRLQVAREMGLESWRENFEALKKLRPDMAKRYLERRSNPQLKESRRLNGEAFSLWRAGQIDQAIQTFERALKLDPKNIRALLNMSSLYTERGRFREALPYSHRAEQADPKDFRAPLGASLAYCGLELYAEALEKAEACLKLCPEALKDVVRVTKARALTGLGQYEQSRRLLNDVLSRQPKNKDAHSGLGLSYQYQDQHKQALPHFDKAIQYGSVRGYYQRALSLMGLKRWDEARRDLLKAAELLPHLSAAVRKRLTQLKDMEKGG